MPLPNEAIYTIDYIESLPEGTRAELIDGIVYDLAAPSGTHQALLINIATDIMNHIRKNHGKCMVFPAPYAVYLNDDDYTYLEPDISVICDHGKLDEKGCHGAPDWILEIVSPSSRWMDYVVKLAKYQAAGVREYWIVNPSKNTVRVFDFVGNETEDYHFTDSVASAVFPHLRLRLGDYE